MLGRPPTYPASDAEVTSLLGLTAGSLYLCQEASGNLADSIGAATLVVNGTPTFQYAMPDGRRGVYYNAASRRHTFNYNAPTQAFGSNSAIIAAVFTPVADPTANIAGVMGTFNAAGASDGVGLYVNPTTGTPAATVRDVGAVNALSLVGTGNMWTIGGLWLASAQIDRAAARFRARYSRWGGGTAVQSLDGSISGYGAIDGTLNMQFGFGCFGACQPGNAISWGVVASGAQCEGSGLLAAIAAAMGFE